MENKKSITEINHYDMFFSSQINSSIGNISNKINSTEKGNVDIQTKKELLADAFYGVDHYDPFKSNTPDGTSLLLHAMDLFETYIETAESLILTESDYNEITNNIKLFEIDNGRVYIYKVPALLFGNSGRTSFVYLQTKHDNEIMIFKLYYNERKDVTDVLQPSDDKNLIILVGNDRNQQGWRTFIDGFYYHDRALDKTNILEEYQNNIWCVDVETNTVYIKENYMASTYIKGISGKMIEIESGNDVIKLIYNNDSRMYEAN